MTPHQVFAGLMNTRSREDETPEVKQAVEKAREILLLSEMLYPSGTDDRFGLLAVNRPASTATGGQALTL